MPGGWGPGAWTPSGGQEPSIGGWSGEGPAGPPDKNGGGGYEHATEFADIVSDAPVVEDTTPTYTETFGSGYTPSEPQQGWNPFTDTPLTIYESSVLPFGSSEEGANLPNDPETWTYGEFGYGPGPAVNSEMSAAGYGSAGPQGPSWADFTEYAYGTGQYGIDDTMFLGGKPGETGYGPGEKPEWYGKPIDWSNVDGGDDGGWGGGYGGGAGGVGGGGGGYGYGREGRPQPRQMVNYYTPQANLQQAMVNIHKGGYKRGGIVSLLRLN